MVVTLKMLIVLILFVTVGGGTSERTTLTGRKVAKQMVRLRVTNTKKKKN